MKNLFYLTTLALAVTLASCAGTDKKDDQKAKEDSIQAVKEKAKEDSLKVVNEKKEYEANLDVNYLKDGKGQWAVKAEASSTYAPTNDSKASWSPVQMTGVPNVSTYGDNGNAWASKEQDKDMEWVKLTFEKEVFATEVRIKESFNPGAIVKIELVDSKNKSYVVFEGTASEKEKKMQYCLATFEKTKYKTKIVKITIDSKVVAGWNEIDAVQLVGE